MVRTPYLTTGMRVPRLLSLHIDELPHGSDDSADISMIKNTRVRSVGCLRLCAIDSKRTSIQG